MEREKCPDCYKDLAKLECGSVQIKDSNGQYGSPVHGKRGTISVPGCVERCGVNECKQKAIFQISECLHEFCGHCLQKKEVTVNFVKHKSEQGFACPICVHTKSRYKKDINWMTKWDVYGFLREKNICNLCFQIKTFDVVPCKHGICFICMRRMLDNPAVDEYVCLMQDCLAKYGINDVDEMYEQTISEMTGKIFALPYRNCDGGSCQNLAVLNIRKCHHRLCGECILKSLSDDRLRENNFFMKCPVRGCSIASSVPIDCLKKRLSNLASTMQLATLYMQPKTAGICDKCTLMHTHVYSCNMYLEFQTCLHTLCISCYEKFMLETDTRRRVTAYLGLSMEMTMCCMPSCSKEIPTVCLTAMDLALKGDRIAITMYFQPPKRNGRKKCIACESKSVYTEIVSCNHQMCKDCTVKVCSESNEWGLAACSACLHRPVIVRWLKTQSGVSIEDILTNKTNYFEELTSKVKRGTDMQVPTGSSSTSVHLVNEVESTVTKGRNIKSLCPSYGERVSCSYCLCMAVILFSECYHGWCLKCLKYLTSTQTSKEAKLQCKDCESQEYIGYAKRFIRKCETDGLLIPSYLKPVGGTTRCIKCDRDQAIFEEIECGHRFCELCLHTTLQLTTLLKCPLLQCDSVDNLQGRENTMTKLNPNIERPCVICHRKRSDVHIMKKCGHASCRDCTQRVFPCPVQGCKSVMDRSSSEYLLKHLINEKEMIFLFDVKKTTTGYPACTNDRNTSCDKSKEKLQIRRCKHVICSQCCSRPQKLSKGIGISTCPAEKCFEFFFIPMSFADVELESEHMEEEGNAASRVAQSSRGTTRSGCNMASTRSDGRKHQIDQNLFSFQRLGIDEHGARESGLPNLGLTCYRNSVYQVLAESPKFFGSLREAIVEESGMSQREDWMLTLCEILWRILSTSTSRPDIEHWLYRLQAEFTTVDNSFVEDRQNDSLSFFTSLLSGIADVFQKGRKQYDPSELFRGQLHDKYTCCKCKKSEFHGTSDFFSLPLPTLENRVPKIGECLFQFFSTETLKDVFPCSFCKYDTVQKEIKIKKYPDILVLQLGMISERTDYFQRVHTTPKFWEDFDGLSNNIHLQKIEKREFSKYRLYGVIIHTGGLTGGHYYAYVKRLGSKKWELCNDSYVHGVDVKEVLRSEAYILFYHKVEKGYPV